MYSKNFPIILHIITNLNIGGTEISLKDFLINYTKKYKTYKHIIITLKPNGILVKEIENLGFKVICINSSNIFKLTNQIKKISPKLIVTYLYRANIIGRIAGKLNKIPVISTNRSIDKWRKWHHNFIDYITSFFTKKIITNSKTVKFNLIAKTKIKQNKIKVIYPGIKINNPILKNKPSYNIAYLGRLSNEKDIFTFLKASQIIIKKNNHFKFIIAGDGHLYTKLKNYIDKNNLKKNIILKGWVKDINAFFSKIDLIIQPSLEEGLSRTILESMSYKIPVIASDIMPNKEVLGKKGIFFKTKNYKDLSEKILNFYSSNSSKYIDYLFKRVQKNFNLNNMIEQWNNIFKSYV